MSNLRHIPALLNETIRVLNLKRGSFFIDGTFGGGGHSKEIGKHLSPNGVLLGIDRDPEMVSKAQELEKYFNDLKVNLISECRTYSEIGEILEKRKLPKAQGILLDLGFSSFHIEDKKRGFSFQLNGPLDMRYDPRSGVSAAEVINSFGEDALADIFWKYGEERMSRRIANQIVVSRKKERLFTTERLARIVSQAKGGRREKSLNPATKTFQALRIYVNDELSHLEKFLIDFPDWVSSGGIVAVISFHGLEDGLVKKHFRSLAKEKRVKLISKKPIMPEEAEVLENPRARSAKLRVLEVL